MNSETDVRAAFRVAQLDSPHPVTAREALQVLMTEVLYRWEQRTALSFRLQDLRAIAVKAGIDETSELYGALHAVCATAEGWMHPNTLHEAVVSHLFLLESRNRELTRALAVRPQPEPTGWIAVDERLPTEEDYGDDDEVLVRYRYTDEPDRAWQVGESYYDPDHRKNAGWQFGSCDYAEVSHWLPKSALLASFDAEDGTHG